MKNLKRLPTKILNNLEDLSEQYLLYIISNPGLLRFRPWNSQIQYLVTNTHRSHLAQALVTHDTLKALNINSESVLNIGTGGGYLEYVCKHFNYPIHTAEYLDNTNITDGVRAFRVIREYFGTTIDYTMTSANKDNFVINKGKKYDWLIFFRFFYHTTAEENFIVDYEKVYNILRKFEKYGTNCIILGRKEWESFKGFKSITNYINHHQYGNISEIISELKTKIL
jgi:hypothetical protein